MCCDRPLILKQIVSPAAAVLTQRDVPRNRRVSSVFMHVCTELEILQIVKSL